MVLESLMKNIATLILTIMMIAFTNVLVNVSCSWYGCYHWTNLFNHDLVCHGCINSAKYMKDYQLMIYMSLGTLVAADIKTMMDHMNPFHTKFSMWSSDESVESVEPIESVERGIVYNEEVSRSRDSAMGVKRVNEEYKIPEYSLGKNSPIPRWCTNSHD